MMDRRGFLEQCGLLAAAGAYPALISAARPAGAATFSNGGTVRADVAIIGGGLGGCAAALAATRMGRRVVLTEETDWIGGQLTQQAVPPDEHRWIEKFGATRSYRALRRRIRDYYRRHYPLTDQARQKKHLNPGNGWVSALCHEPRVALAALEAMLAPAISTGQLTLLLHRRATAAETDGDRVRSVTVADLRDDSELTLEAPYFVDATELGDVLPLAGAEYVTGSEAKSETGEPHASEEARPGNSQAVTWCFAVDYVEGEDHTIPKPERYDFWRQYAPELQPPWPGELLAMNYPNTRKPEVTRQLAFAPYAAGQTPPEMEGVDLWTYRRIIDHRNFEAGTYPSDATIVNWPQNDYMEGTLHDGSEADRTKHWEGAKQLSLSLMHWLQTEAPRPDGGTGWPGLRLRGDLLGTAHTHGLAKYPYIREGRRIRAETTIVQQHVWPEARMEKTGKERDNVTAKPFDDSVGVGHYSIDLHPSTGGDNYIHLAGLPFRIPLGSMIPQRLTNLIPGCKNIGTTHLTNGCYRLHPVEWNIGEAAGALAAFCLDQAEPPTRVRNHKPLLRDLQDALKKQGFELDWSRLKEG